MRLGAGRSPRPANLIHRLPSRSPRALLPSTAQICYDIRFPHLALLLRQAGCSILLYPGALNLTTGPAHWELLQRSRAQDTQCYESSIRIARNPESSYTAWGHSTVVNPWGEVIATTAEAPAIVYADLDMARVAAIRDQIPVGKQTRQDLYSLEWKGAKA